MARLSWHKRNHDTWFADMGKLSMDERAVLPYLVDLMHITEDNVENDDRELAYKLRLDIRRWRKVKASLLDGGWIYIENGMIRNRDVSSSIHDSITACKLLSDRNRTAGRKSGEVRREISRLAERDVQHHVEQTKNLESEREKESKKESISAQSMPEMPTPAEAEEDFLGDKEFAATLSEEHPDSFGTPEASASMHPMPTTAEQANGEVDPPENEHARAAQPSGREGPGGKKEGKMIQGIFVPFKPPSSQGKETRYGRTTYSGGRLGEYATYGRACG